MQGNKQQKVFVVLFSDALLDPDAVVIEPRNAHFANRTVLRPRRLLRFACLTHILLYVDNAVIVLVVLFHILLHILLGDLSWLNAAALVVHVEASIGQEVKNPVVVPADILVWEMLK